MKTMLLELYKLRHKRILLMVFLFLFVELAWGLIAAGTSISRNSDQAEWEMVIALFSSMNGLFYPILTAICVSRICDMEHKGNTWKLLLTLSVRPSALYAAKFFSALLVMFAACLLQVLAIAGFGMINGFVEPVPVFLLIRFFIGIGLTTIVVIALQQWVSMAVKNQAFALSLGMIGGFLGMTADLLPQGVGKIFIWSYYTGLSPITQSYTDENIQFIVRDMSSLFPMMALLIAAGVAIYLAGSFHLSRIEV